MHLVQFICHLNSFSRYIFMRIFLINRYLLLLCQFILRLQVNKNRFSLLISFDIENRLTLLFNLTVLINSEGRGNGHPWNDVYFIPVTNYLIFNSGDYLGRILAGLIEWVTRISLLFT